MVIQAQSCLSSLPMEEATGLRLQPGSMLTECLYSWFVPNTATNNALIKITKEGTGETSITNPFTIIGQPTVTLDAVQCEGYINVNWNQ